MENWLIVISIGIVAGVLGGIFGVGGGVLIVPALVLLIHMSQHTAVGTSLGALLPPVGVLGAWAFYRRGEINLTYSLLIGLGLMIGAWFGAYIAGQISDAALRRAFAIFLIFTAIQMLR